MKKEYLIDIGSNLGGDNKPFHVLQVTLPHFFKFFGEIELWIGRALGGVSFKSSEVTLSLSLSLQKKLIKLCLFAWLSKRKLTLDFRLGCL